MMKRFILIMFLAVLYPLAPLRAQDIAAHERKKAQLEDEISLIDRQLRDNNDKHRDVTQQIQLIRRRISNREKIIRETDAQINTYASQIRKKETDVKIMRRDMDTLLFYYEKLIRAAYRNRDSRQWFAYIFSGKDFSEGIRRYGYFKNLSKSLDTRAAEIKALEQRISDEISELERLRSESVASRRDKEREVAALRRDELSAKKTESALLKNRQTFQRQLSAKKKEVNALNAQIKRLVEEAMRKKDSSGEDVRIDYALSGEFSSNKGKIPWPTVSKAVIEGFGQNYHPVLKGVKLPYNYGINVLTEPNAKVCAVFDGVVKQVVVMPGYSQCVLVQHGEYFTFYCKLGSVAVKSGQKIDAGEKIGTVDTINGDTIFHFQIWKGQEPQNPELWLRE